MTSHDQQTTAVSTTPTEPEFSSERAEMPVSPSEPAAQTEPPQAETVPPGVEAQSSDDESLFAAEPSGLRSRWDDIQASFVDDPSGCVQKADSLVEEVIEELTSRFTDTRSHLEAQWARGETASTEDLRVALTRYREFFQRLLAV